MKYRLLAGCPGNGMSAGHAQQEIAVWEKKLLKWMSDGYQAD